MTEREPKEIIQALINEYKTYKKASFLIIPILAIAAAATFFNRVLSLVLLAAAVIYQIFYLRKKQKNYLASVTRENLLLTTAKKLHSDAPLPQSGGEITAATIHEAELITLSDDKAKPYFAQGMSGTYKDVPISVCDATLPCFFKLKEKGKKRIHMNSGAWFHLTLPKKTDLDFRLIQKDSFPTPMRLAFFEAQPQLINLKVPDIRLNKDFALYGKVGKATLSGPFLDALKELSDYTPGRIAISVRKNQMDVFLRGRFFAMPITVRTAPSEKLLTFDPMPELDKIVHLASLLVNEKTAR